MSTANDMFESLTGFDEIAIAAHFGRKITALGVDAQENAENPDPFTFLRALIFVDKRRQNMNDPDAYKAVQALTIAETQGYFSEDDDEDDAGKEPSA
ncbi:hypothetical protein EUA93_18870 [Nocardioides oleivorans]|uniref:Uncharacterized protein n=1 Tax=Nocardioides oleivorans TaxID=273676 RepID=A0A4Q2RT79_9ACTN|nr:hypothetical protein [Nocardioides oleivorans]RYB90999.1 hypothetical protein EUA93_18870 [Nocardioides oleivorans]